MIFRAPTTFSVELLQQVFVPFDVVALPGGHRGKVHLDKVGDGARQSPVERVKATAQVDDLARLLVADLLEHLLQAHLHATDTRKVAPVNLGRLAHCILHKVAYVVVLPVSQLDGTLEWELRKV